MNPRFQETAEWGRQFWVEPIGLVAGSLASLLGFLKFGAWVDGRRHFLPTFIAVTPSLSLWLVYGIIVNSIAMIVSNI